MKRNLAPRLDRSITLNLRGDLGLANFHRICSWLSHVFLDRAGKHSRVGIWNGTGGWDNIRAVGRGEADLGISTPAAYVKEALNGGRNFPEAFPHLRAIAVFPQDDAMVFALPTRYGVNSFDELIDKRPPLRIAIAPNDGNNMVGTAAHQMLTEIGITREVLESWGGEFVQTSWWPGDCIDHLTQGRADAVIQEAIMTPWWHDMLREREMTFLGLSDSTLSSLKGKYGWGQFDVPANYFPKQPNPFSTLEFSNFLVYVTTDMPEDVAHLITWCLLETTQLFTRQFMHIPPERRSVTLPLLPQKMAMAGIPLHHGAKRYYLEAGIL
jgi:TRAP-type uncharacterized transport system substrate-binding protein